MSTYAWQVEVRRRGILDDKYVYTVAARTIEEASRRALRQVREDSGYTTKWKTTSAVRGGRIVT